MRTDGYACRVSKHKGHPRRLKDESELAYLPDKRVRPLVGTRQGKWKDHSRINPIMTDMRCCQARGSYKGALRKVERAGKKADYSKAGVARACVSFEAESMRRRFNWSRSKNNRKLIPATDETHALLVKRVLELRKHKNK